MRTFITRALLFALLVMLPGALSAQEPLVVYLVRHAEKVDDSANPELSAAGTVRAAEVARVLGEAGITRVFSTDFTRTQETATPLAAAISQKVESYNPRDLPGFAATLKGMSGRVLVVGHSNTTPALVTALGGDAGPPIPETEYDRLYVLTLTPGQPVVTVRLRFGAVSAPK